MTSPTNGAQPLEVVRQGDTGATHPQAEPANLRHAAFDHAALAQQRYLSGVEAAAYLRFCSLKAFREWARRQHLPVAKAGRLSLYRRDVLEAWVEQGPDPKHGPQRGRRRVRNATQLADGGMR